jgi:hypothetical protein
VKGRRERKGKRERWGRGEEEGRRNDPLRNFSMLAGLLTRSARMTVDTSKQ